MPRADRSDWTLDAQFLRYIDITARGKRMRQTLDNISAPSSRIELLPVVIFRQASRLMVLSLMAKLRQS